MTTSPNDNTPVELTPDQMILKGILTRLAGMFDNQERDINGGDAVALVSDIYRTVTTVSLPLVNSVLQAQVIYSASEEGFWSHEDGWGHIDTASHFFEPPSRLPMSSRNDAQMVTLSRGYEIEKELSGSDNPAPTA